MPMVSHQAASAPRPQGRGIVQRETSKLKEGTTMSALGQKQTCAVQKAMSALLPIATAKADTRKRPCPLYPRKRTCAVQTVMSALGQKRTFCNAAQTGTIRSPHRRGTAVIVTERLRGLKIEERHANRRTSDLVGRCYRHHRHRNWLCRQIGDERDGLWTASATRKRGTRLVAGQGSPRHRFWSSGNRRHYRGTR